MDISEIKQFAAEYHEELCKQFDTSAKDLAYPQALKVVEEVGELCEAILQRNKLQRKEKLAVQDELEHECADVILTVFILSHNLGVDIEKALIEKIEKIKNR